MRRIKITGFFLSLFMLMVFPAFAQKFQLAGSFNGWNPQQMSPSSSVDGVYKMTKNLNAGTYYFQVLKDGIWPQSWQGVDRTFTITKNNTPVTFYARKEGYTNEYGKDWLFFCDAQEFYLTGPAFVNWSNSKKMVVENRKATTTFGSSGGEYMVKVKAHTGGFIDNDVMIFTNEITQSANYVAELDFETMLVNHQKLSLKSMYKPAIYIGKDPQVRVDCKEGWEQGRTFNLAYGEEFNIGAELYTRPVSPNVKVTMYVVVDGNTNHKKAVPLSWIRNFYDPDKNYDSEWRNTTGINLTEELSSGEHILEFWFEAFDGVHQLKRVYSGSTNYRIKINVGHIKGDSRPTIIGMPTDKNYILTAIPLDETDFADFGNNRLAIDPSTRVLVQVGYFDGMGRPVQEIQAGITPLGKDLVTLQEYDGYGRESNTWLPGYGKGRGIYTDPEEVKTSAKSYMLHNDSRPYSYPYYERSPLLRPQRQHGPGKDWDTGGNGKAVEIDYLTNEKGGDKALKCMKLSISGGVLRAAEYASGELFVTRTKDEDGRTGYEFTDKLGQVVLTRQMDGNIFFDTYFFYDQSGNLQYVIPPVLSGELEEKGGIHQESSTMKLYAYVYEYDKFHRCIGKKLPGADWIYYIYDKAGRLILSQDGEQRVKSPAEWSFNKYDVFGRVILSGIYPTSATRASLTSTFADIIVTERPWNGMYGYTSGSQPDVEPADVLVVNYYDDYDHLLSQAGANQQLAWEDKAGYGKRYINSDCPACSPKGLLTATRVKRLNDSNREIVSAFYYDDKGRLVQQRSTNHTGGLEKEFMAYDFVGNLLKKYHEHTTSATSTAVTETWSYVYDHAGRLMDTWHKINNEPAVCLSQNTYNEKGELKSKKLHANTGSNSKNTIAYAYNIRGWITSISSPLFYQHLFYNTGLDDKNKSWSGNIGRTEWKTGTEYPRYYSFTYDGLSRMKKADYSQLFVSNDAEGENFYSEEVVAYDKNGNIRRLKRNGLYANTGGFVPRHKYGNIDDLTLNYNGNQLLQVTESSPNVFENVPHSMDFKKTTVTGYETQYRYDRKGRMVTDYNKYIHKIEYNLLDLPKKITTLHGHQVEYMYDAAGVKRQAKYTTNLTAPTTPIITTTPVTATHTQVSTTDYYGNKIYREGNIAMVLTPEGYLAKQNGSWQYNYYLRDHLGNIRVVQDASGNILESTDYYPFGMPFAELKENSVQPYKFGGKELESMHGLNVQDFEARWKDVSIPIFTTPDPLAELRPWESLYSYCGNNPLRWVDMDGRFHGAPPINIPRPPVPAPTSTTTTAPPPLPSGKEIAQEVGKFMDKQVEEVKFTASVVGAVVIIATDKIKNIFKREDKKTESSMEASKNKHKSKQDEENVEENTKTEKPTKTERMQAKKKKKANNKKESSSNSEYNQEKEHTENARNSTENKHEKGQSRKKKDKGGEKADVRRERYK
ncbi:MAG: DUF6443 domain-containing protein [Candidatus Azobacteroides sp.]|nr:DUF6443 domain-containing protein [Candidatus Azobacteroides sp.]